MASNSKKRRRVLGASCILAALIIASSSFAWFTSKDEVTNRLSANADYDVKIVESFTPTRNWLPGQEVDKDVFAVNTGSIGAFVEEDVTSKITLTQEKEVATFDAANCVKLTPAERYSVESGSYLAYVKPTGTGVESARKPGTKVVSFVDEQGTPKPSTLEDYDPNTVLTDFSPDVAGLYVFRRSIDVKADGTEEFEYEAYYYDGTDYFKAKLTSVTPDDELDKANDNKDNDGNLSDATAKYYQETTGIYVPKLEYLDDGTNKWLIATVDGTEATGVNLSTLGDEYDEALHNYETALAALDRAVAEDDDATEAEKTATKAYNDAQLAKQAAEKAYNEALATLNATKAQLAAAIAERDTATNGVKDKRNAALNELYGAITYSATTVYTDANGNPVTTLTPDTHYKSGSLFDTMLTKYNAIDDTDTTAKEDFFEDLKTYAPTKLTGAALTTFNSTTWDDAETQLDDLIDLFSYDQLSEYANTRPAGDNHNTYKQYGEYYAAKKAYETKLAEFKALDASLDELDTRIGKADPSGSGLIKQFEDQYKDVYGADALTAYNTDNDPVTYTADVAKAAADKAIGVVVASDYDTYKERTDKYGKLLAAIAKEKETQTTYEALVDTSTTSSNREAAELAAQKAAYALEAAKQAYEDGLKDVQGANPLKINIKLSNAVTTTGGTKDKWQLLPTSLVDASGDGVADTAKFYYTGILLGGETSAQLIDSVTLDSSVTDDMYKSFDFDLNIAMKSAQILYADDNETILATAANGDPTASPAINGELDANATLVEPTNIETGINWTPRT